MRKVFAELLHQKMKQDKRIWLLTGDLGFGLWDKIRDDFPDRFINTGAAEQAMMGIAVGLAQAGKVPFVYSITPFLLYRPFETIRNYVDHEKIPVQLIGSGRNRDYHTEGFSHWAEEDHEVLDIFANISGHWPENVNELPKILKHMCESGKPNYLNLTKS